MDLEQPFDYYKPIISKGWPTLCNKVEESTKKVDDLAKMLDDGVYIVQKGVITNVPPKNFGEDTLIWRNGKVSDIKRMEQIKLQSTK